MGEPVTPRKGTKSAPSDAPSPHRTASMSGPSRKSAPTEAPSVKDSMAPRTGGDYETPTSMRSNVVDEVAPRRTGSDANITRS